MKHTTNYDIKLQTTKYTCIHIIIVIIIIIIITRTQIHIPEPCTIIYVSDGDLGHPVQVCVLMSKHTYQVNEQYLVPGKSGYRVWGSTW